MISQRHRELVDSAFANLSGSLSTVAGLESPALPQLPSKREWQGHTPLSFWGQLLHRKSPWRCNELHALDNALQEYSQARIRYERLADSNERELRKLTLPDTDTGIARRKRRLKALLDSKGRELKAYERAVEAAEGVLRRYDHWSSTNDFHLRRLQKRPGALWRYKDHQIHLFLLKKSAVQLGSRRSKLTQATDGYQSAHRGLRSHSWAALRRAGRSLLRLDLSGAMMDLMYSTAPNSLLQSTSQLRKPNANPNFPAPTPQRSPPPLLRRPLPLPHAFHATTARLHAAPALATSPPKSPSPLFRI